MQQHDQIISFAEFLDEERWSADLYYVQPDGTWKKGGDGRSKGKTKEQLPKGAKISEHSEVDEALDVRQRIQKARTMKRNKARIRIGQKKAKRRMADAGRLRKRAQRQARAAIIRKITRGGNKSDMNNARKKELERRMERPALRQRTSRLAKRILPQVRKKEVSRKRG